MISCKQMTELVTDYLEGRLNFTQRLAFQMHLGMCKVCRAYLAQMRETVRLTGKASTVDMPAAVEAELLQRFRHWQADPTVADPAQDEGLDLPMG
jgi:predicted anti-sigma-YlaC factor YlaD